MCLSSSTSTRKQEKDPFAAGGSRKEEGGGGGEWRRGEREREKAERNSLSDSDLGTSTFNHFLHLGKYKLLGKNTGVKNQRRLLTSKGGRVCFCVCAFVGMFYMHVVEK